MGLNHLFDNASFIVAHNVFCLLGVFLCLYVMQLWSSGAIQQDHPVIMQCRRGAMIVLALALLWSLSYAYDKAWDPWPADVLIVIAVDAMLAVTIAAATMRGKGLGGSVDKMVQEPDNRNLA